MEKYNFRNIIGLTKIQLYVRYLEDYVETLKKEIQELRKTIYRWQDERRSLDCERQQIKSLYNQNCKLNLDIIEYQLLLFSLPLSYPEGVEVLKKQNATNQEIIECEKKLDEENISLENRHSFSQSLSDIFSAINSKNLIDGIDIYSAIRKKDFRFYTQDQPLLSLSISTAFAEMAKSANIPSPDFAKNGRKKRIENVDKFAKDMHEILSEMRKEKVLSYKETAKELNERKVSTYSKGKWRESSLTELNKRFVKLGLCTIANMHG